MAFVGGDGTIREIAPKLILIPKTMGIIPMGTANDLCKTLKIPGNLQKSFDMLLDGGGIFWIAPKASVTDGKLHFITMTPVRKWLNTYLTTTFSD